LYIPFCVCGAEQRAAPLAQTRQNAAGGAQNPTAGGEPTGKCAELTAISGLARLLQFPWQRRCGRHTE
jgi:hypothetical protein